MGEPGRCSRLRRSPRLSSSRARPRRRATRRASSRRIETIDCSSRTSVGSRRARARALKHRVGAWTIRTYLNGSELLRVRPGRVAAVVKALRASGQVRYAEPDYIERESAVTVPNDPSFAQQWAFQNTGQSVGGEHRHSR